MPHKVFKKKHYNVFTNCVSHLNTIPKSDRVAGQRCSLLAFIFALLPVVILNEETIVEIFNVITALIMTQQKTKPRLAQPGKYLPGGCQRFPGQLPELTK